MHGAESEAKYKAYIKKNRKVITRIRHRLDKQERDRHIEDHMTIR